MTKTKIDDLKMRISSLECDLNMVIEQGLLISSVLDDLGDRIEALTNREEARPVFCELYRIKQTLRLTRQGVIQMWLDCDNTLTEAQ